MLLLILASPASAVPRGLDLGFSDDLFTSTNAVDRAASLDAARNSGAGIIRINLFWRSVAPNRPAAPQDPADPAYRWSGLDAGVRDAQARGLGVLLTITGAPAWAEGPGRPSSAAPGTWKPDPRALGDFATAAARRYPTVTRWQIWNEPNLYAHLTPQWTRRKGHLVPAAAQHYRRLLNSAYSALKAVSRRITVVTAGDAPYGDPPGAMRTRPLTFWKEVLKRRTSFDVFAHQPYSVQGPRRHALNRDDVSVPDVGKLTRLVRSAVKRGTAVPRRSKPLWITEIGWDSNPPDPSGVPARRHAAWLADSFYVFWKQRATKVIWTFVRDQAPTGGYDVTYQSGVYLLSGAPKPAQQAFAFPVACERIKGGKLRVWGKAPAPGRVVLMRGNRTVKRLTAGPKRVFLTTVPGRGGVRAKAGSRTSLQCVPA